MPLYQYREKKTGGLVELSRPVAARDAVAADLERISIHSIHVHMHGRKTPEPVNIVRDIGRGLRQCEEKHGLRHVERVMQRSAKGIKRVWNDFKEDDQPKMREV